MDTLTKVGFGLLLVTGILNILLYFIFNTPISIASYIIMFIMAALWCWNCGSEEKTINEITKERFPHGKGL